MAKSFSFRMANAGTMSVIFDLDGSVGQYGINRRDDTMLVQYLLNIWIAHGDPSGAPARRDSPIPPTNGICEARTIGAIKAFEVENQVPIPTGRVEPLRGNGPNLLNLNLQLYFAGGHRGSIPSLRVPFPQPLVEQLFRP